MGPLSLSGARLRTDSRFELPPELLQTAFSDDFVDPAR